MTRKIVSILVILFLLGSAPLAQATSRFNIDFTVFDIISSVNFFESQYDRPAWLVKSGEAYDASKDPALRTGTQNWEEPQGSFFIVPALLLGVFALILFFKKK